MMMTKYVAMAVQICKKKIVIKKTFLKYTFILTDIIKRISKVKKRFADTSICCSCNCVENCCSKMR